MAQETELQRVKARIKALTEKTVSNGCTEAEAMAAAEMVGRLLERYALCMAEIDVRESACVEVGVPVGGQRRRPIDICVPAIARFCDCKVWLTRAVAASADGIGAKQARYIFFGFEADTTVAAYLFAVIGRAIDTELAFFRKANPKLKSVVLRQASASFQQGMAVRIGERLIGMHEDREASVNAQRATGTALILMKHQAVDDAFRETTIKLAARSQPTRLKINRAFRDGCEAGDRVNLNRPVSGAGRYLLSV